MKISIILAAVTGAWLSPASADGIQATQSVYLKDSEVYIAKPGSGGAKQLTHDGKRKGLLVQSKDGGRFAFVRESKGELADILVMGSDGTGLSEIHFRPVEENISGMRGVEELEWISDDRLVASGSINPSTAEYAVLDVKTGRQVGGSFVDGYSWQASPDGSHMAYVGYIPHFTSEENRRPQFCLDNECSFGSPFKGYPGSQLHLEFITKPTWSPDGTAVAIVAENYETKAERIIVRALAGRTLDLAAPSAPGALDLCWDGKTLIVNAGARRWRLEPDSSVLVSHE